MNDFSTIKEFKQLIEEYGLINVKDIYYDARKKKWVVEYKPKHLTADEFELFSQMLDSFDAE